MHGWWLVPFNNGYSWGWYLVSLLGLPMLASLVTGLVVYKRFWKGFFKPRLRISQRIFWGDFHRLSGIWSIWFIAIISITGTWFLIRRFSPTITSPFPARRTAGHRPQRVPTGHTAPRISLDEAVRIATEHSQPGRRKRVPARQRLQPDLRGRPRLVPLMYTIGGDQPYTGKIEAKRLLGDRTR